MMDEHNGMEDQWLDAEAATTDFPDFGDDYDMR